MRYSPYVDVVFKKLFGSEENTSILLGFINAVLGDAYRLKEITLLNPYQPGPYAGNKLSILDIKARDEQGRYYNIEMQVTDQVFYSQRALYYWSKLYSEQLKQGENYDQLNRTISIHVLSFNHFDQEPHYHNVYHVLNVESHKRAFEDFEIHFIELQKFKESAEKTQIISALDRWATFLSGRLQYDRQHIPDSLGVDPDIVRAIEVLDTLSMNDWEKEVYEGQMKWLRDEAAGLQTAELRGVETGKEIGMDIKAKEIAKALLLAGHTSDTVVQLTGLSPEEVRALSD